MTIFLDIYVAIICEIHYSASIAWIYSDICVFLYRMMYFYLHPMPCPTIQKTQYTIGRYIFYYDVMHMLLVLR